MVAIFVDDIDGAEKAAITVALAKALNAAEASGVSLAEIKIEPKSGGVLAAVGDKWICTPNGDKMECKKEKF